MQFGRSSQAKIDSPGCFPTHVKLGTDAMQAEIRAVREKLLDWSANHDSWEIRMWCNSIARYLGLLIRDPDNLALRQQTATKVRDLGAVTERVLKFKSSIRNPRAEVQPQHNGRRFGY
jgi:hypothetical protein